MSDIDAPQTDLAALERFVAECDELRDLEAKIGRFNIFDALGVVEAEIRHSNFLAWLLDPAESHGQGPLFLKAVLMDLLRQSPPELRPAGLSPITLDGGDLHGVEVRREWHHIDILITCKEPRFVITIENKVKARQGKNQLTIYADDVLAHFAGTPHQFVYLTRRGDQPNDKRWNSYTYRSLHGVLSRLRMSQSDAIDDDVLTFFNHYLKLLEGRFMDNPQVDELCRTIYRNHRRALQLIFGRIGITAVKAELSPLVASHPTGFVVYKSKGKTFAFQPKSWLDWIPEIGGSKNNRKRWLHFRLGTQGKKLRLSLRVGRVNIPGQELVGRLDAELRRLAASLQIEVPGKKGMNKRNIALLRQVLLSWTADEPEAEAMAVAVTGFLDNFDTRFGPVADALRPIIEAWEREKKAG